MQFRPLAAALLCAAPLANAQETAEPVIITASRVAESADESLAAVTVIDRRQIEESQAHSLSDLLRAMPGVNLNVSGGRGKLVDLMMRGTGPTHTLVLIDGVRIGSATNGQAALQDIPAAQIERIEVVRGPRSSLYGSEAIGGVIQIFTRRARPGFNPNVSTTIGSYGTLEFSAGATGTEGHAWYSAQVQGVETAGFNACPGCAPAETDDDGYSSASTTARVGYRFNSGLEAELHALRSHSDNEYDGYFQDQTKSAIQVTGARLAYELSAIWHAALTLGQSSDNSDNYKAGVFSTRYNSVRDSAAFQNDLTLGSELLTVGFDYQADRIDSSEQYARDSRIDRGLFAQYRTDLAGQDVQLALRGDDSTQFGFHRTGNLALGFPVDNHLRVTAAYGTAFKAPTLNDLYYPYLGNPDLKPETAASTELGLQSTDGPLHVGLRLFRTDVGHLINWACTANCGGDYSDDVWHPMNVDRARIDGAELEISGDIGAWQTRFAFTSLDPRDVGSGLQLARRARASARLDLDRNWGAYRLGTTVVAEGDRFDDVANTRLLPGYATIDLRGEYAIAPGWSGGARIENLLDQDYRTAADYAQAGRSYYLTLRYQP